MSHHTDSHSDSAADAFSHLRLSCSCSHCLTPARSALSTKTATFHPFPRLPAELRIRIWELTVEPRTVEVRIIIDALPPKAGCNGWDGTTKTKKARKLSRQQRIFPRVFSPSPVPGIVQACSESRRLNLYPKAFSDLPKLLGSTEDLEERYIYLNLDTDMVSIGTMYLALLKPVAHLIKRLRFTRGYHSDYEWEYWERNESNDVRLFVNTEEIHVVCEFGNFGDWTGSSVSIYWPCGVENVTMVKPDTDEELPLLDLEYENDRMMEEGYFEAEPEEGVVIFSGDESYYPARGDVLPDDVYTSVRRRPGRYVLDWGESSGSG